MDLPAVSEKWKRDLADFQCNIAGRWQKRANETPDVFSKFIFYFIGFNALYHLWGELEGLPGQPELNRLLNLAGRFDETEDTDILLRCKESAEFFERRTVSDMRQRNVSSARAGSIRKAEENRSILANHAESSQVRLKALARILYQVRNNLAHGSKETSGDDEEIVRQAIEPTRTILDLALSSTHEVMRNSPQG
ncbi:MAG: hypothetical protein ACLP9K_09565 [Nitrososphaerales archaeon]